VTLWQCYVIVERFSLRTPQVSSFTDNQYGDTDVDAIVGNSCYDDSIGLWWRMHSEVGLWKCCDGSAAGATVLWR